uniref:Wd repeat-containing protein 43 n=1 Tax=Triatoma infestans TaxID=30076 RepID=A0A170XIK1_TRIIF
MFLVKWKCKGIVTRVAVSPTGDLCVTGNINITLWEVKTQQCLRNFIGHSSELCNLIFINEQYFLSCGINDRHIAAWTTNSEDDSPIGRFSLSDNVKGEISTLLVNTTGLHMVAVTSSGSLLYFTQQLNGKVNKSIKPIQKIELVHNENTSEANSTKLLPVVCGHLKTSSVISVAYGFYPNFGFETVSISTEHDKQTVCVSNPEAKRAKVSLNRLYRR